MADLSTKPYLIRAIYEWCADCGFTPYLSVRADQNTRVPLEYVKNGEIVLSISQAATRNLTIGNDVIQFTARFNGVSREVSVPVYAVLAAFARENGKGVYFDPEPAPECAAQPTPPPALAPVPKVQSIVPAGPASAGPAGDQPPPPDKPKAPPRGNLRVIK
ncbi:MAG: ClpXP protease specificity-enhancing factor [Betaproteobacteria bacterium]|nr:ClpXP protease specificity-enhancing factor [Betaproteobacteria bacterium]